MKTASFHILRVGTAITFLWIGILILKDPQLWGGFIQSWVSDLLPISTGNIALGAAFFDIFVGVLLLVDYFAWLAALLGAIHIFLVLFVSGINAITIRDIGLLAAAVALFIDSYKQKTNG
ncbi:MAG: DoxX family membrane protein [Candidatus Nealsonbacteria bacterium]|nr:DoxX family membrane protein [Candidatus Nealsonbacteria bacterium]